MVKISLNTLKGSRLPLL